MLYSIFPPDSLDTSIKLPSSKSISNRALVIQALSGGGIAPQNLSVCDDTEVMVKALKERSETIDIKAAGTAMRFLTAYFAATPGEHILTGTDRMKQRPIGLLVDALRYLGADITYLGKEGFPPLKVKGRGLEGGRIEIPGNISSQYISALLMIGPVLAKGLELKMTGTIVSRPYIELTLWMMREFGADADWSDSDTLSVAPKPYKRSSYLIESDWTAASYWYEIMALESGMESSVRLDGLMDGSKQGDSVVRYIFSLIGVKSHFADKGSLTPSTVRLKKAQTSLPRLDYDFVSSPDLAQTVAVTCALLEIPFKFTGLASLRIKEADRIEAVRAELLKLGYVLSDDDNDILEWNGEKCEPSFEPIKTYDDHRMAMAFAPAAIRFPGIKIADPGVVTKSYPGFWDDLRHAGFKIVEQNNKQ